TLGAGSTFWLTVNLKVTGEQCAVVPEPATSAEILIRQHYQGYRILLVDDEPLNLEIAEFLMEESGLIVDTAKNGALAVRLAKEHNYALILMDMQMPVLDGLEATQQIRALPSYWNTPIVAMTANAFVEDKALCLAAGMNDFLIKPFDPEKLFSVLLKWFKRATAPL
ncbi:MAG: response regulator, partial [Betaproteobacteria bacterium]